MKKLIFLITLNVFTLNFDIWAQSNDELAKKKTYEAIQLMDKGEIEKSLQLLDEAFKLNPNDIIIPYEIAYAHYLNKDYKKAIENLEPYLQHPKVQDIYFSLMGNSYDYLANKEKAVEYYLKGIDRFPDSGPLHLEMGIMKMKDNKFNEALMYFSNGIKVAPKHPSNYYWASKLYGQSSEKVWGALYAELFMNMERGSKRTEEISNVLFNIYQTAIQYKGDTSIAVDFSSNNTLYVNSKKEAKKVKLPFGVGVYEPTLLLSLITEKEISVASLVRIRTHFVKTYFEKGHHKTYPNALFNYQKKILDAGHFEAYNYWLLMFGEENTSSEWISKNKKKWESFIQWYKENPIQINEQNFLHSSQY